jgi:predicted nucleic acid-binding protein
LISLVLDASIAVKWAVPSANETLTAESLNLLRRYTKGEINFIVPDVFWAETGNVLWKGVRRRRWTQAAAKHAAREMRERNFLTVSSLELLTDAIEIAFANDCSVYDCLYVALAIQFQVEMITADERLANALAARLPVKWLGGFAARHE